MKKKIFVGIAMLILCLSFSISAFALTEGDWEFQLLDDEVTITGYLGEGGDVVIPEKIYGATVTKIEGVGSFSNPAMFFNKVTSITFPPTVKEIKPLFSTDRGGYGITCDKTLKTVIIPNGVEIISSYAFANCDGIENIIIPTTVTTIDSYAFTHCDALKNVTFVSQSGLKKIGKSAFTDCGNLKEIYLPDSLQEIADYAFSNAALKEIYIPNVEKQGKCLFKGCSDLKKAVLAFGTTKMSYGMFSNCTSLEYVELPNTLEEICLGLTMFGEGVFQGCTSLEEIVLPTSLKRLNNGAFCQCSSLKEVVIPYGVEFIGDSFQWCKELEALYIPDTVKTLDEEVIENSPNCVIYCTKDSNVAQVCKKNSISYLTDNSVNSLITVYYNGTRVSFHEQGQNPELINSRTLVPLRAIFEAMDAEVEWNQETKTVIATRDGVEISISIGANAMYKDGEEIAVDVPAQLINDRTMVPVRVIAEAFGANVEWNNNGRAVLIEE